MPQEWTNTLLFYLWRSTFTTTTPRSSCVAREMSTCWRTSTRTESPKPSSLVPCWRLAVPLTCVNAWCTPSTCFCRDAAKPTVVCFGHCWADEPVDRASALLRGNKDSRSCARHADERWICAKPINFPTLLHLYASAEVQNKQRLKQTENEM